MHPKRKQRLIVATAIVVLSSAAIGLVAYALRGNINLFYPPADVVAGMAPTDRTIRVGGMVVEVLVVQALVVDQEGVGGRCGVRVAEVAAALHESRGQAEAGGSWVLRADQGHSANVRVVGVGSR